MAPPAPGAGPALLSCAPSDSTHLGCSLVPSCVIPALSLDASIYTAAKSSSSSVSPQMMGKCEERCFPFHPSGYPAPPPHLLQFHPTPSHLTSPHPTSPHFHTTLPFLHKQPAAPMVSFCLSCKSNLKKKKKAFIFFCSALSSPTCSTTPGPALLHLHPRCNSPFPARFPAFPPALRCAPAAEPRRVRLTSVKTFQNESHKARPGFKTS